MSNNLSWLSPTSSSIKASNECITYSSNSFYILNADNSITKTTISNSSVEGTPITWLSSSTLFNNPVAIRVFGQYLYVVNSGNNKIIQIKINTDGSAGTQVEWASNGLTNPYYIASNTDLSSNNFLYVLNTNNKITQIQIKIDGTSGTPVDCVTWLSDSSLFNNPSSLRFISQHMYVTNSGNGKIVQIKINLNGSIGTPVEWVSGLSNPQCMHNFTLNSITYMYVLNKGTTSSICVIPIVSATKAAGTPFDLLSTGLDNIETITNVSLNLYNIYMTNSVNNQIVRIQINASNAISESLNIRLCFSYLNGLIFNNSKTSMYLTNYINGTIYKFPLNSDGTAGTVTTWASGLSSLRGLILLSGYIYVSNSTDGTITRILVNADGTAGTITTWLSGLSSPQSLVFSPGCIYVSNSGDGSIRRIPLNSDGSAGTVTTLVSGLSSPQSLIINGTYMYVANSGENTIRRINLTTGILDDITTWGISGLSSPQGLVIDGTYMYVSNSGNSTIRRINLNAGILDDIITWGISGLSSPQGLVINGTYMYTANATNNTISKLYIAPDGSCYNEGTKILCLNQHLEEEYIPIENLRKGDFVKTYEHGFKKINLIGKNCFVNDPTSFDNCMYKMVKTVDNGLIEDLLITGWHAVLVDELGEYKQANDVKFSKETPKIDDKYLLLACVSNDFTKVETIEEFTYYHFVLESDDIEAQFGVWANGVLSESTSESNFLEHSFTLL